MLKGNNNKALAKMLLWCVKKNVETFIGKIRCLMHLTRKVLVKFEVNDMGDHMVW